jgi:hypothetical protein
MGYSRLIVSVSFAATVVGCGQNVPTKVIVDSSGQADLSSEQPFNYPSHPVPTKTSRLCPVANAVVNERYNLPGPAAIPAGASFLSDWAAQPTSGGYSGIQAMDTCRVQPDSTFQTWHGKPTVRFEVNPGDDPLVSSGTERAEMLQLQDAAGGDLIESGIQYYAMSYYFPHNWDGTFLQGNANSWSAVMQLYGWSSLQAGRRSGGISQTLYFVTGLGTHNLGAIHLGSWVDLVIKVNWSTGQFSVYRRNQDQIKFSTAVSATDPSAAGLAGVYFKQGLYRGPDVNGRTDILWTGPTARAGTFLAAEQAAFGTNNGF